MPSNGLVARDSYACGEASVETALKIAVAISPSRACEIIGPIWEALAESNEAGVSDESAITVLARKKVLEHWRSETSFRTASLDAMKEATKFEPKGRFMLEEELDNTEETAETNPPVQVAPLQPGAVMVDLEDIDYDPNYFPRSQVDIEQTVVRYTDTLLADPFFNFPAITVTLRDQRGGRYIILDGVHRYISYTQAGRKQIPVLVERLPQSKWFARSVELNAAHGKQLTIEDRAKIVQRLEKDGWEIERIASLLKIRVETAKPFLSYAIKAQKITARKPYDVSHDSGSPGRKNPYVPTNPEPAPKLAHRPRSFDAGSVAAQPVFHPKTTMYGKADFKEVGLPLEAPVSPEDDAIRGLDQAVWALEQIVDGKFTIGRELESVLDDVRVLMKQIDKLKPELNQLKNSTDENDNAMCLDAACSVIENIADGKIKRTTELGLWIGQLRMLLGKIDDNYRKETSDVLRS